MQISLSVVFIGLVRTEQLIRLADVISKSDRAFVRVGWKKRDFSGSTSLKAIAQHFAVENWKESGPLFSFLVGDSLIGWCIQKCAKYSFEQAIVKEKLL